jgi:hypothetical protein
MSLFYHSWQSLKLINIHNEYNGNPILSILANDTSLARLRGHLQIDGDIILWTSFWVNLSKLMMGVDTLDTLISSGISVSTSTPSAHAVSSSTQTRMRSDSEIARELQAEFDGTSTRSAAVSSSSTGSVTTTPNKVPRTVNASHATTIYAMDADQYSSSSGRPRSDSEIARELQEQFYSENDTTSIPSSASSSAINSHSQASTAMVVAESTPIRTASIMSTDMNVVPQSFRYFYFV